jgi:hypothetical protein
MELFTSWKFCNAARSTLLASKSDYHSLCRFIPDSQDADSTGPANVSEDFSNYSVDGSVAAVRL